MRSRPPLPRTLKYCADPRTAEAVLSHAGRVFGTARRTISEDGRTLTITFRQENQGILESNVAIYRKQ